MYIRSNVHSMNALLRKLNSLTSEIFKQDEDHDLTPTKIKEAIHMEEANSSEHNGEEYL